MIFLQQQRVRKNVYPSLSPHLEQLLITPGKTSLSTPRVQALRLPPDPPETLAPRLEVVARTPLRFPCDPSLEAVEKIGVSEQVVNQDTDRTEDPGHGAEA